MPAENATHPATPDTTVLVHGFWMTPRSWEKWVEGFEVEVEALREDPSPIEANLYCRQGRGGIEHG